MNQTLVIGSAVVDVIVRVEHLPKCGEDVHVSRQSRSLGGCAYLVSDILRHFGAPYSLCTAVGGGMYGDFVYEQLKKRGVPRLKVVYSTEAARTPCLPGEEKGTAGRPAPASVSFVPGVAGLIMAGEAVKDLSGVR